MKGRRWRSQEDALLKKTVLEFIRTGRTQLAAFAHVGRQINRTPGACGFRWNAVLRQQDPVSYQEAKKRRVYDKLQEKRSTPVTSLQQAVMGLQQLEAEEQRLKQEVALLQEKLRHCQHKKQQLREERLSMDQRKQDLSLYQQEVRNKYQNLLHLLEENHPFSPNS
jgi:prespore-specific regulator